MPAPPSFLSAAASLGIEFEPGDLDRLARYLELLLDTNKVHNLTAVTDPDQAWTRHILDSLTLMPLLAEGAASRTAPASSPEPPESADPATTLIDVGSGGGLPGVPLAIVMPDLRVTLLEATGKKAEFLSRVVAELGLANARVLNERAERAGQSPQHRERYDFAVARAVGPLPVIAELTVPLARVGGRALLIKGQKADEELAAAKQALYLLHAHHAGTIDTPTGRIVVLEKPRKTPRAYPRKDGEPKRAPLGE
jgi:16S rRNA (guanine527-N7)-methyltransferase